MCIISSSIINAAGELIKPVPKIKRIYGAQIIFFEWFACFLSVKNKKAKHDICDYPKLSCRSSQETARE